MAKTAGPWAKLIALGASLSAGRQLRRFRQTWPHCRQIQNHLLQNILHANAAGEFGRQHKFQRITGYSEYIDALPLLNYSYLEPYINRCRDGDSSALFGPGQKILMFALTSGTTATAKHIPVTQSFAQAYQRGWNIWGYKALEDHPDGYLRGILQVTSPIDQDHTSGGIPIGAISGLLAQQQKSIVRKFYVTDPRISQIKDPLSRYYTIMRLALPRDVAFISTANPSTTLRLVRIAEEHAPHLIRDIHDGTLQEALDVPTDIRAHLKPRLCKNPARAAELEKLLQEHGRLLPQHYWNLSFLANWTGGALSLYLPRLQDYFGHVPIRDIGLLASEGRISIPFEDNTPAGVLDITANFYEFVFAEEYDQSENPDANTTLPDNLMTFQASQLEKGGEYYLFLTNQAGLYRYNLGDRIRVVDHVGTTPVIEFLSKGAHMASITGEKLTENQVVAAVRTVADGLAIPLDTFVMIPQWDDPPHYRLFFEAGEPLSHHLLEQFAHQVDDRLSLSNMEYDSKRDGDRLGPLDVRQVPPGLIRQHDERLMQSRHAHREQFKHRFLHNKPLDLSR
ncbi:MAG: GH3 auxin-responsive promoter family protein [Sedimentisphaerales bacterium]|nr:GH3 auxin-responsive promoter family protein [Sedimentisphaerales bacterium]